MSKINVIIPNEIKEYGYTDPVLCFKGTDLAKQFLDNNIRIYRLYSDNTKVRIVSWADITDDDYFGIFWDEYNTEFGIRNYNSESEMTKDVFHKRSLSQHVITHYHKFCFDIYDKRSHILKIIDVTKLMKNES